MLDLRIALLAQQQLGVGQREYGILRGRHCAACANSVSAGRGVALPVAGQRRRQLPV